MAMSKLTPEESNDILRRLFGPAGIPDGGLPIIIRATANAGSNFLDMLPRENVVKSWVNVDDLMMLLTKLSEAAIDDQRPMAFRGLRDLLEAIKYDRLKDDTRGKK